MLHADSGCRQRTYEYVVPLSWLRGTESYWAGAHHYDGDDDDDREDGRAGGGSGSSSSGSGSGSCAERGVESGDGYSKGRAGEARSGTAIDAFYGEATDEVRDALWFKVALRGQFVCT